MTYITIEARQSGYGPDQLGKTITAGELIAILEDYDEDTPVIISNDHGYTYGEIRRSDIDEYEEYEGDEDD